MLPSNRSFLSFGVVFHFHDLPCLWGERVVFFHFEAKFELKALYILWKDHSQSYSANSINDSLRTKRDARKIHKNDRHLAGCSQFSTLPKFNSEAFPWKVTEKERIVFQESVFRGYVKLCGCMMVYVHFIESTTLSEPGLDKSSILNTMPRETPRNDVQEICF